MNPVRVEVSSKYQTVSTLKSSYLFVPAKHKDVYFAYLMNELAGNTAIVFTHTCATTQRLALLLRALGFGAVPLHGQLSQPMRLSALNKFKAGERAILIATDVASRGLDIPSVDAVINYDVPVNSKVRPRAPPLRACSPGPESERTVRALHLTSLLACSARRALSAPPRRIGRTTSTAWAGRRGRGGRVAR